MCVCVCVCERERESLVTRMSERVNETKVAGSRRSVSALQVGGQNLHL